MFITKNGTPYATNAINFILKHIVTAHNKQESMLAEVDGRKPVLLPHISAHILRHTGCTRMAECGLDPKILQYIMGHADIGVTMNIYNHVDETRMTIVIAAVVLFLNPKKYRKSTKWNNFSLYDLKNRSLPDDSMITSTH